MTTSHLKNSINPLPWRYGFFLIALVCVALSTTTNNVSAGTGIISFDAPGAATVSSPACAPFCGTFAQAINAEGAIVGGYTDANVVGHAFLRKPNGQIISFDAPGADLGFGLDLGTVAMGINSSGVIAGQFVDSNNLFHGFVRFRDGSFTTFDAPGAGTTTGSFQGTIGNAINSAGVIAGSYFDNNNASHGFVRFRNGTITTFDAPGASTGAGQGTAGIAINSKGDITGFFYDNNNAIHGFLRDRDGSFTTFDTPGAGTGALQGTFGLGINSEGDIGGTVHLANDVRHGFLRDHDNGTFTTFKVQGAGTSAGQGTWGEVINNSGVIAGFYADRNTVFHGYVRHRDGTITKFDPPGTGTIPSSGAFQYGTQPIAINDAGAITGSDLDNNNVIHAFLRLPCDENHGDDEGCD